MFRLTPQTVAEWLINKNGNGSTDEQFVETFKLMEQKVEKCLSKDYTFLDWLKDTIEEIEYNSTRYKK